MEDCWRMCKEEEEAKESIKWKYRNTIDLWWAKPLQSPETEIKNYYKWSTLPCVVNKRRFHWAEREYKKWLNILKKSSFDVKSFSVGLGFHWGEMWFIFGNTKLIKYTILWKLEGCGWKQSEIFQSERRLYFLWGAFKFCAWLLVIIKCLTY